MEKEFVLKAKQVLVPALLLKSILLYNYRGKMFKGDKGLKFIFALQ